MAETNLYKLLSGLYTAASNINTKVGNKNSQNGTAFEQLTALSTAVNGKFTPRLANGTSGLVYSADGGDVTISQGVITLKNGVVDTVELANSSVETAKIADKNVTSAKLEDNLNTKIGHGETAYGKVSGTNGEWHKHTNMAVLSGISSTNVSNWNDANSKKHTHANLSTLSGIGQEDITRWDAAANANHTHGNLSVLSGIKDTDITNWNNGALVSAVVLEKTTTTTGYAATYQLKVNGTAQTTKIDIVKDQFIKSATFGWANDKTSNPSSWSATKPSSGTSYPCIKIEVWTNVDGNTGSSDTTATTIYVPLADVFQEYVGGSGIKVDGNTISLSGIPSNISITSSQLPTIPSSKLENGSTYQTAVNQAKNWSDTSGTVVKTSSASVNLATDHIVLGNNNNKTVKSSDYTVVSASADFGANTLATAPAITGYIAAQNFQAANDNFVTAAADLTDDTIVLGTGTRGIKASTAKIATASGAIGSTASGAMVPTAGAVSSYVANKTTGMVTGSSLAAGNLVIGDGDGKVKNSGIASGNVVTAAANLPSANLIVGNGTKGIASSNILTANVVTNSTADATVVEGIIVAAAKNKSVKATAYTINTTTTSGGITDTANQIPNVQAVKAYTDAVAGNATGDAKNYLLNGNAGTSTGVTEWAGGDTTVGSLAELNKKVNDLLTSIK